MELSELTYDTLKSLSQAERINILKQLSLQYQKEDGSPNFKAIGEKIGCPTVAIAGMFSREVNGMKAGRREVEQTLNEQKEEQEKSLIIKEQGNLLKPKRGRPKKAKENQPQENEKLTQDTPVNNIDNKKPIIFTVNINGTLKGDEAQARLSGIANSFLTQKAYKIKVEIEEV